MAHFGATGPSGSWLSYELVRMREWLLASSDYLERRGTPGSIEALGGHELLSWLAPGEDGRLWPTLSGEPIEVEPALVTADIHLIRQCVIAGLGIGFMPDIMLPDPGVAPGTLVPVLADRIGRDRALHIAIPSALAGLPKLQAVIRHLQAFLERSMPG